MTITCERTTRSERETMQFAAALAAHLRGGEIITLDGPLGAGKTCFVRGMAQGLGIDSAQVSSPTFVLVQEYERHAQLPKSEIRNPKLILLPRLLHVDAYRMHGEDELDTIGWEDIIATRDAVIAIEWPSRIDRALEGRDRIEIIFEHISTNERRISITACDALADRLENLRGEATEIN